MISDFIFRLSIVFSSLNTFFVYIISQYISYLQYFYTFSGTVRNVILSCEYRKGGYLFIRTVIDPLDKVRYAVAVIALGEVVVARPDGFKIHAFYAVVSAEGEVEVYLGSQ